MKNRKIVCYLICTAFILLGPAWVHAGKKVPILKATSKPASKRTTARTKPPTSRPSKKVLPRKKATGLPPQVKKAMARIIKTQKAGFLRHDFKTYMSLWTPTVKMLAGRGPKAGKYDILMTYQQIADRKAFEFLAKPEKNLQMRHMVKNWSFKGKQIMLQFETIMNYGTRTEIVVGEIYRLKKGKNGWQAYENRWWPVHRKVGMYVVILDAHFYRKMDEKIKRFKSKGMYWRYLELLAQTYRFAEARDFLANFVQKQPRKLRAWLMLGYMSLFTGHISQAKRAFRRAQAIFPNARVHPSMKLLKKKPKK